MLNTALIKKFIDEDTTSIRKRKAQIGQNYYNAKHDILKNRLFFVNDDGKLVEDVYRSNIKISHPFFTLLTDQLASHTLSFKDNPLQATETAEGLQEHLDTYFDAEFWDEVGECIKGAYSKGFDYIYAYKGENGRLTFQEADSMGVVEVRAKDTDDDCDYFIYWYVDRINEDAKVIKKIQVWTDTETHYFKQVDNGEIEEDDSEEVNPRPHVVFTDEKTGQKMGYPLGFIPFWRLDNNKKQISGLDPIKELIDDYDLHACSLSNNLKDFDTPIHVVSGFQGDNLDELQMNLKSKKVVGVDAEGGIDVKTVDIPYQARKEKLDLDEKNIYKFGMGMNTSSLKDSNATTNMAIKAAFFDLDLKASAMAKRLGKLMKNILKVVLAEINKENGTDYQLSDVKFDFARTILTNDTENIQNEKIKAETRQIETNTILSIAATLDDETVLKKICDVIDVDYEDIKDKVLASQEEGTTATAQGILDAVNTDPIEE